LTRGVRGRHQAEEHVSGPLPFVPIEVLLEQRGHTLQKEHLSTPCVRLAELDGIDESERVWRDGSSIFREQTILSMGVRSSAPR
jgi:hypothetical protein